MNRGRMCGYWLLGENGNNCGKVEVQLKWGKVAFWLVISVRYDCTRLNCFSEERLITF